MKWMRVLWAGALLLLLALSGCSSDKTVQGGGSYSPVITGIAASPEPAVRNQDNQLTVLVTNVNNYPLTYHWSSPYGVLTDSTHQTAVWQAPDSVGTYPVTCSIVTADPPYYKSTTFQVFVDNKYVRWTRSEAVQFDPAPMTLGGVVFAQYRSITAQTSDVFSVSAAGADPVQLTSGISIRGVAHDARGRADARLLGANLRYDSVQICAVPGTGGDPSTAGILASWSTGQRILATPRFARTGTMLLYSSDTVTISAPRPWYRDAFNLTQAPFPVFVPGALSLFSFYGANWGPGSTGIPDSIITQSQRSFGAPGQFSRGLYKVPSNPPQSDATQWLADSSANDPDWSPDGQYVIFSKTNAPSINSPIAERDIWIVRADATDKSQEVRVTFGAADDSHPRFSADGASIYFVSNRADRYGLNGLFPLERRGTNIWSVSDFDLP